MDGDDLEESEPSEPKSLAEIFSDAFPYYLAMGMTYDEFWRGNPSLVRDYRKAYEMRRSQRNWEMWMQGAYVYDAVLRVSPVLRAFAKGEVKPLEYPKEPYPITEKEARERKEREERENFKAYIEKMEAASARELKRREKADKEVKDNAND